MWYNLNDLLSKNRIYNYIIGIRGGGKTFACQMWCIRDFKKTGNKFIWLRRYNTEIDEIKKGNNWCSRTLREKFPEDEITTKGKNIYLNGKHCGVMIALSTAPRVKSINYDEYDKIIFDEFLIDSAKSTLKYMPEEGFAMDEFYETVDRLRDVTRVVFVGNAISVVNPHFKHNGIKPDVSKEYTMFQDSVIHLYTNDEFLKVKQTTRFGRKNKGTSYGEYAMENKFIRDNHSFIAEKPKKDMYYSMTLIYNRTKYGVWLHLGKDSDSLYIDEKVEDKCTRVVSMSYDDLNEQCKFRKYDGMKAHIHQLKYMFNEGKMYFDSIETKKALYEVVKVL